MNERIKELVKQAGGEFWQRLENDVVKENISKNNKSGTDAVRQKLREANLGKKNPEHSKRMAQKTGLLNKNTRLFQLTTPSDIQVELIGVAKVREYCKDNNLAFDQLFRHLNNGKIETILAKNPRPSMRNCLGYELKEIIRKA